LKNEKRRKNRGSGTRGWAGCGQAARIVRRAGQRARWTGWALVGPVGLTLFFSISCFFHNFLHFSSKLAKTNFYFFSKNQHNILK
jgi:hypothetical protein